MGWSVPLLNDCLHGLRFASRWCAAPTRSSRSQKLSPTGCIMPAIAASTTHGTHSLEAHSVLVRPEPLHPPTALSNASGLTNRPWEWGIHHHVTIKLVDAGACNNTTSNACRDVNAVEAIYGARLHFRGSDDRFFLYVRRGRSAVTEAARSTRNTEQCCSEEFFLRGRQVSLLR